MLSFGKYLQNEAMTLGFYKIQENCENVIGAGKMTSDPAEVREVREDLCLTLIEDEIDTLKDNVVSARTVINYFYNEVYLNLRAELKPHYGFTGEFSTTYSMLIEQKINLGIISATLNK